MNGLPDAVFIIDVGHEKIAVSEARKLGIPIIGIVDTNTNPDGIDYVIPGNDDAMRAIQLYVRGAADSIVESRAAALQSTEGKADAFVEVDESKEETKAKKPAVKKATIKKAVVKKAATKKAKVEATDEKEEAVVEKPAAEEVPAETEKAAE